MEVLLLHPHGYCVGVRAALSLALTTKEKYPDRDVYLLGLLVHNEETMEELSSHGLIPLDERKKPLLDHLLERKKGDVVVFSAHGHPEAYEDLARDKGLIFVDATCNFVQENLRSARSSTSPILYVGVAGHLESEAFLANCPDATFYDVKSRRCNFLSLLGKGKGRPPVVITQTTLSYPEVEDAMKDILSFFPEAKLEKERCHSTSLRQKAILDLPKDIDAVVVLGSTRSNNSLKLAELASSRGYETHLCLGLEEVKQIDFGTKKRLALCSGASTSDQTFLDVANYLRSL